MSNPDDTDATPPQHPVAPLPPLPPPVPPTSAFPPPPPPPPPNGPAAPPRAVARHERESRARALVALAVACFLAFAAIIGYSVGANQGADSTNASGIAVPSQQLPTYDPSTGSSSNGQQTNIDLQAITDRVSPSVVNLVSIANGGEGAGTAIVLTASGLALTNNHVIAGSTELQAEIEGSGEYQPVKVLGYSIEDDVALVQIEDVSDLTPATIGDSSSVDVGDAVVALGNAGGKGGDPTVVSGIVSALGQQITASDQDGSNAETLENLIQIDANIQPGDSGGPLVDVDGKVIGMNAAASRSNGGFGFGGTSGNEGYAITIEDALDIVEHIKSDDPTDTIHVGARAGVIGVSVGTDSTANGYGDPYGGNGDLGGSSGRGTNGNGAYVQDVQSDSAAEDAGIKSGATIVAVDGTTVTSAQQLTHTMVRYNPGDEIEVEWIDASGQRHSATIELGSGPPA